MRGVICGPDGKTLEHGWLAYPRSCAVINETIGQDFIWVS